MTTREALDMMAEIREKYRQIIQEYFGTTPPDCHKQVRDGLDEINRKLLLYFGDEAYRKMKHNSADEGSK